MELQPSPVEREARRLGLPVLTPATLKTPEAPSDFRAHQRRCRGRRRLWPDPAEGHPRCAAARLLQPARLAAAALARRRADQPRHHGGRRRDRRHGDEDGRGARHRRCRDDRARRRSGADMTAGELHDALARLGADLMVRALAALERGTLQLHAAARRRRHLRGQDRQGRDADRLEQAGARGAHHIRGLSPFPGAWCEIADRRRAGADQGAALRAGEGHRRARHGARRSPHHRLRRRRDPHRRVAEAPAGRRCRPRISCAARR